MRRPRPRPSNASASDNGQGRSGLTSSRIVLSEALTLSRKAEIDRLLERRRYNGQEEAAPPADEAIGNNSPPRDARFHDDDANGGVPTSAVVLVGDNLPLSDEELTQAYTDVYGRPPPNAARLEERLAEVEREVWRLPPGEADALMLAMRSHALLFVNCPHTKAVLERNDGEEEEEKAFDAATSARRLARYWDRRRALFGDSVCYAPGTFPNNTFAAYKKLYARTLAVADDPDTDDKAREHAEIFVRAVHDLKVEAVHTILEQEQRDAAAQSSTTEHIKLALQSSDEETLHFLRAEDFIEGLAAQRMMRYFETALTLFGSERVWRQGPLLLDEVRDCSKLFDMRQGRLMPGEDSSGRTVVIFRQIISDGAEEEIYECLPEVQLSSLRLGPNDFARAVWYILQAALEREACQRNGLVVLLDCRVCLSRSNFRESKLYREAQANVLSCFPVKTVAVHFILSPDRPWWQRILSLIASLGLSIVSRGVVHAGSVDKTAAQLSGEFGIGLQNLPADLGGALDDEYFSRWLEDRKTLGL